MHNLNGTYQARARSAVERLNMAFLSAAAERRQGLDRGHGARSPAGLGQPRRDLVTIEDAVGWCDDGEWIFKRQTPIGYQTARASLPPVLAALGPADPRRIEALKFAATVEKIGAIAGADLAGSCTKGAISDGGATTKVKHAARFNRARDVVNGWEFDHRAGRVVRGAERIAFKVQRRNGKAFDLLCAVCVDGLDMGAILRASGWSAHGKQRKALAVAFLELLDLLRRDAGIA